jgi:hypothetical protein
VETVRGRSQDTPFAPYEQKKLHRLERQKTNAVNSRPARILLLSRGGVANCEILAPSEQRVGSRCAAVVATRLLPSSPDRSTSCPQTFL